MKKTDKCDLLVVDDEPNYRLFLEDYFKQRIRDIKIKVAKDGKEAYSLALKFRPRIIWTCIRMPRMSGFDLIELIRKNQDIQNTKIIIYTAYGGEETRNEAFKLGADAFIHKGDQEQIENGLKIVADLLKFRPDTFDSGGDVSGG